MTKTSRPAHFAAGGNRPDGSIKPGGGQIHSHPAMIVLIGLLLSLLCGFVESKSESTR